MATIQVQKDCVIYDVWPEAEERVECVLCELRIQ
jgi:hypothetical protein